jgi:2-iminobutanoate/2-iminopropanoate deaminase
MVPSPAGAGDRLIPPNFVKPFAEAVRVGDVLYLSGEIGLDYASGRLAPAGIAGETEQALRNIGATLARFGLSFDAVFKCTVMLKDMDDWAAFNAAYLPFFAADRLPARSAFGTSGLAFGALVEIECMARFA